MSQHLPGKAFAALQPVVPLTPNTLASCHSWSVLWIETCKVQTFLTIYICVTVVSVYLYIPTIYIIYVVAIS